MILGLVLALSRILLLSLLKVRNRPSSSHQRNILQLRSMIHYASSQVHTLDLHQHTVPLIRRFEHYQERIPSRSKQLQTCVFQEIKPCVYLRYLFICPRIVDRSVDLTLLGGFGSFAKAMELLVGNNELSETFKDGSNEGGRDVQSDVVVCSNVVEGAVVLVLELKIRMG